MVIDTSAIFAAIANEPDGSIYRKAIQTAPLRLMSALTLLETPIVLLSRLGPDAVMTFDQLIRSAGILVEPWATCTLTPESKGTWGSKPRSFGPRELDRAGQGDQGCPNQLSRRNGHVDLIDEVKPTQHCTLTIIDRPLRGCSVPGGGSVSLWQDRCLS